MDDNGNGTRDIAMSAKALIDHHMTDCETFRENLREDMREFREDLKKLNWKIAALLGGLVVISHLMDWALGVTGHK